jgi:hypothetical protein
MDFRRDGGRLVVPDGVQATLTFEDIDLVGGDYGPGTHAIS